MFISPVVASTSRLSPRLSGQGRLGIGWNVAEMGRGLAALYSPGSRGAQCSPCRAPMYGPRAQRSAACPPARAAVALRGPSGAPPPLAAPPSASCPASTAGRGRRGGSQRNRLRPPQRPLFDPVSGPLQRAFPDPEGLAGPLGVRRQSCLGSGKMSAVNVGAAPRAACVAVVQWWPPHPSSLESADVGVTHRCDVQTGSLPPNPNTTYLN